MIRFPARVDPRRCVNSVALRLPHLFLLAMNLGFELASVRHSECYQLWLECLLLTSSVRYPFWSKATTSSTTQAALSMKEVWSLHFGEAREEGIM